MRYKRVMKKSSLARLCIGVALAGGLGCGPRDAPRDDGSGGDTDASDQLDLGPRDAASPDRGSADATPADVAPPDGGPPDGGPPDGGPPDAERPDAAAPDAAAPADGGTPSAPGAACDRIDACGDALTCFDEPPGGYCLPGQAGSPHACREPELPCPVGTACSPLPYHAIAGVCLATCDGDADCRPGYLCRFVELFPGDSTSPRSARPVCWIACQPGVDQSCNQDPVISSLRGTCLPDGSCACADGSPADPDSGRCR